MTERSLTRRCKRGAAVLLLTSLAATSLIGLTPAGAAPPPAQDTADFCANVPDQDSFTDVNDNADNIECMAFSEITTGLAGGTTYGPARPVSRAQMASFIARMIDTANGLELVDLPELPATGRDAFTDDGHISAHHANINRLAAAGVVAGTGGGLFRPDQPVSRAQMATFINNAQFFLSGDTARFTSTEDFFTDDERQTAHEANINGLAAAGIVQGGPGGTAQTLYGPELSVNRSQMASFVIRYLAVLEADDVIEPVGTPATNQTFTVTPTDEVTSFTSTSAVDNTGRRAYTARVTGATVDILLLPAEFVTNTQGQVSLRDVDPTADRADPGTTPAKVELVNGAAAAANTGYLDNVAVPASGTVTFSIDSTSADSVIPVVFTNAAVNNTAVLALDANNKPTVGFGIGGRTNWAPPEAANGASVQTVTAVNAAEDFFVGSGGTSSFFYDGNDAFRLSGGIDRSQAQFEALLTVGDTIAVTYDRDEADKSIFNVTTDVVPPPTQASLKVVMSDLDADGVADDATLTWNPSAQADARYNVYIDVAPLNDTFSATDTAVQQDVGATTVTINNANGNTYHVGAEGGLSSARSTGDPKILAATPVDNGPRIRGNGAVVNTNAGGAGATAGDVWVLYLNEAVSVASDASIQLTSGTGP